MAVVINSAVSEAWRMNQFHIYSVSLQLLTAHQRLYVLWKQAYCTCRKCSMLYRPTPGGVDAPDFRSHPLTWRQTRPPVAWYSSHRAIGQLILGKIIKIVATGCQILRLKCTWSYVGWGSAPDPAGWAFLQRFLRPLVGF